MLAQAGYLRSRRAKRDARQRVWVAFTPQGRKAFGAHVAALREIVGDAEQEQERVRRPRQPATGHAPGPPTASG